jgi:heptosyltransferase II
MEDVKKIIVRLPNWLGDQVMSTAFIKAVQQTYPGATVDIITKKGIDFLLDYFPRHNEQFIFDKKEYGGPAGAWRFGKMIGRQKKYDLFFCLPDSLSSAIMARASGAAKRIGFKKEGRSFLLTHSYKKIKGAHRVEEYVNLLEQFSGVQSHQLSVGLCHQSTIERQGLVVNINSEAPSRRLPQSKALSIISSLQKNTGEPIILVGSPKEKEWVDAVYELLPGKAAIQNMAGLTSMQQLVELMANSKAVLTTDSGPAHVSNALGTPTLVLFGAGNELNTAPYNNTGRVIMRLGKLSCEPCTSNTCKRFGVPECLLQMDEIEITQNVLKLLINPL